MMHTGFTDEQWATYISHRTSLQSWANSPLPDPLPKKTFTQTHRNLPILKSYKHTLGEDYWRLCTKRTYAELTPASSWISPSKLEETARELNYKDFNGRLRKALKDLRGADIGCEGNGRMPTKHPNSESALEYGDRVADSLQG